MRLRRRQIDAAAAAGREQDDVRAEQVQVAVRQAPSENAATRVLVHEEIKRQVLNKEFDPVREASLVEGMQYRVAGPVGGGAGAPSHPSLAVSQGMTTKGPLIDLSALAARERYAKMLELDD